VTLKRNVALTRRTGLKPGKGPTRGKPLARQRMKRTPPTKRNDFPEEVKAQVRRRSGNVCELCRHRKATDFHHRKLREHGDNRAVNCLHLCVDCHTAAPHAVHRNVGKSYLMGWLVRSPLDPAKVPVRPASGLP
jgi:hypothetical protein